MTLIETDELCINTIRFLAVDAVQKATDLGNIRVANTVLLGAMSTGLDLTDAAWRNAVETCVPDRFREINLKAFELGRGSA